MRGLMQWQPGPKSQLRHRMDRWFDQFFADPWSRAWLPEARENGHGDWDFAPLVDVKETEANVVVRAELPGVDAKEVSVELVENVLVLSGSKNEQREEKEGESTFSEFRYGSFRREIVLPADVDPDSVQATCEKGILTVRLQKSKVSRSRKITVEAR